MESFTYPIGLRILCFGSGMVNVVECQKKLIIMGIRLTAKFRSTVRQYPQQWYPMLVKEGNHPVVKKIGGINGNLAGVKLGKTDSREGVNEGLLVNPAYSLEGVPT